MNRGTWWGGWLVVLAGLTGLCSLPASAQQGFEVLIDTNGRLIGCDVATPDGVFEGAEYIITVTPSTDGSQITALSIRSCNPFDGTFGAPRSLPGPPLPIGQGLGTDGSSVLEFLIGASELGDPAAVRLGLVGLDSGTLQDTLLTRDGQPDGGAMLVVLIPPPPTPPAPIPTLNPWSLALLVVLLGMGLWLGRRLRRHPLLLSLLISGLLIGVVWAIELDGDPADWAGIDPLGTDPAGDGIPDIRAFFGTRSNGDLVLRIDAVLNQPPQAQDDALTTDEDSVLNGDVLADNSNGPDSDPDNDPLTVIEVDGVAADVGTEIALASGALLTVNADGSFVYNPNGVFDQLQVGDDPGEDGFSYTISDGRGGTDTATVTITITPVNDPPAPQDDGFTVAEGGTLDDNVRTNDSDPDNDLADLAVTPAPVSAPNHASAFTLNGDGSFSYTHDGSETSSDSFEYELCDPEPLCATATVTITVTPVNDAPVLEFPTAGTVNYDPFTDVPVILDPAATVTDVDSADFDGGVLTADITTNCNDADRIGVNDQGVGADQISVSGTDVSFGDPALLIGTITTEFDCTTADPLLAITLTADATLPAVQALLQNLTFSTSDDTGTDPRTVEVTVSDGDGGTSNTVSRQVTLDQAPRLDLDSSSPADGTGSVALDSTITLSFSESVAFSGTGTTVDCNGTVPFTVSGSPGSVITLDPDSDLPGGVQCTVTVAAADVTDTDNIDPPDHPVQDRSFSFTTVDSAPQVQSFTPTSPPDQPTDTTITITFSEAVNIDNSANGAFEIECPDSSGVLGYTTSALSNVTSVDITPDADLPTGQICTVDLTAARITDVDAIDPPDELTGTTSFGFMTDAAPAITATSPTDGATDVEPNAVVTIDFSEAVTVAGGAIGVSCDGSGQSFTLGTPDGDTVTLTPTSTWTPGTACTVTLTAASITDTDAVDPPDQLIGTTGFGFGVKPVADADGPFAVTGNIQIAIAAPGVYDGDQRGSTTPATVASFDASSSQGGNVSVNADGSFTYNPPAGYTGGDSFTYTLSNANGTSDPATVSLTVSDRVWFIDNSQGCPGDGRFTAPFCTIANFNGATTFSGDYIALRTGTYSETDGIDLGNGQVLIGNAVQFDTVFSASTNSIQAYKTFAAGTAATPTIVVTGAGNHGVQLAQNNTVRGLNVGNTTGTGAGLFGSNAGTVTVSDVVVTGQGIGVNINGGTLNAGFDEISSSNNAGILLNNISGDFDVATGTVNAGSNTAVSIVGNPTVDLGVTLTRVSANGAANGIVLTNTTGNSGGFTVTGDGNLTRNDSGGVIQNTSSHGVVLTNANNVTFRSLRIDTINTAGTHGIFSTGGSNYTFSALTVQNINGGLNVVRSSAWRGTDLGGVNRVDNDSLFTNFGAAADAAIDIRNSTANMTSFTIDDSNFTNQNDANGKSVVFFESSGTVNMGTVTVGNGSQFSGLRGIAFQTGTLNTSSLVTVIENNVFRDANPGGLGGINGVAVTTSQSSAHTATISDNDFDDVQLAGGNAGSLAIAAFNTSSLVATDSGNAFLDLDTDGDVVIDAQAIRVVSEQTGGGAVDVTIDDNDLDDIGRQAIFVSTRNQAPDVDVQITNNGIGLNDPVGFTDRDAIAVSAEDDSNLDTVITGNQATGTLTSQEVLNLFTDRVSAGNTPVLNATIETNTFTNANGGGADNTVIETLDAGETICVDMSGNSILGVNTIDLTHSGGTLNVTQASEGAMETANGGANVIVSGTVSFNQGVCPQPTF